jgi:hypothetical protein
MLPNMQQKHATGNLLLSFNPIPLNLVLQVRSIMQ